MEEVHVVTCFLENGNKILILCRSGQVGSYRQRWAGISGHIEEGATPLAQAWQEIKEEAGLAHPDISLVKEGETLEVEDENLQRRWVVHPFRFHLRAREKVVIDWEHSECRWIDPEDIKNYATVPGLYEAWEKVR